MDYSPLSSVQLVFNSNTNETCVDIPLDDDLEVENVETFGARISSEDPEVEILVSEIDVFIADTTRKFLHLYICNDSMMMAHVCVPSQSLTWSLIQWNTWFQSLTVSSQSV